nr:MAG TPA: hypothetical protein [Caudoviricetes sp.]
MKEFDKACLQHRLFCYIIPLTVLNTPMTHSGTDRIKCGIFLS